MAQPSALSHCSNREWTRTPKAFGAGGREGHWGEEVWSRSGLCAVAALLFVRITLARIEEALNLLGSMPGDDVP